jgi:integrase/recombinase XerD
LIDLVDRYIKICRAAGYAVTRTERRLRCFARFASNQGDTHIRTETALDWCGQAASPHARYLRLRELVRFARHMRAEDVRHELPPAHRHPPYTTTLIPHLYSADELRRVLDAASQRGSEGSSCGDTYRTLFGLLATAGLRVGEVLRLQLKDLSTEGLVIRETKFKKSRLVPLHSTTHRALEVYRSRWRRSAEPTEPLFISIRGDALHYNSVHKMFNTILRELGLRPPAGSTTARSKGPRLHDLRHTFAMRALEDSPDGRDAIRRHMLALTTYLGHVSVRNTYTYLHVSPRLMVDIADACEAFDAGGGR